MRRAADEINARKLTIHGLVNNAGLGGQRGLTKDGFEIRIGDEETLALLDGASIDTLPVFNEWRGGLGMSLAVARRILNAHGGHVAAPPDGRNTGAIVVFRS